MDEQLSAIDELLRRSEQVDEATNTATLRELRGELVHASVFVSYAIGVTALDLKILDRCQACDTSEIMQMLVDEMPEMLSTGWVGGGWSLSPDASVSVAAASQLTEEHAMHLLDLHAELVTSDLGDLDVVSNLRGRVAHRREALGARRDRLEEAVRTIQQLVRQHYATGVASVDDWLK